MTRNGDYTVDLYDGPAVCHREFLLYRKSIGDDTIPNIDEKLAFIQQVLNNNHGLKKERET